MWEVNRPSSWCLAWRKAETIPFRYAHASAAGFVRHLCQNVRTLVCFGFGISEHTNLYTGFCGEFCQGGRSVSNCGQPHHRDCAWTTACAPHERRITAVAACVVDRARRHWRSTAAAASHGVVSACYGAAQRPESGQRDHDIHHGAPDCLDRHAAQYAVSLYCVG
jgi:hypothetical protein